MRTLEEQKLIYECWQNDYNQVQAGKFLGISRGTIKDYYKRFREGFIPGSASEESRKAAPGCSKQITLEVKDLLQTEKSLELYSFIFGMYLGDGYIVKTKELKNGNSVYRFRLFQDIKYQKLIAEQIAVLEQLFQNNVVNTTTKDNCTEIYFYNSFLPILFPQHGPGKKHERKIELENWQKEIIEKYPKEFVRGLIITDGCRLAVKSPTKENPNKFHIRYEFCNVSEDIKQLFMWACSLINVKTRIANSKIIAVCNKEDNDILESFIGPKS